MEENSSSMPKTAKRKPKKNENALLYTQLTICLVVLAVAVMFKFLMPQELTACKEFYEKAITEIPQFTLDGAIETVKQAIKNVAISLPI